MKKNIYQNKNKQILWKKLCLEVGIIYAKPNKYYFFFIFINF